MVFKRQYGHGESASEGRSVYMDANATTPLLAEVLNAMMPWYSSRCGNASSNHSLGQGARSAVDRARSQVADLIGAQADEVVFTSGGTEADNLAIFGSITEPGAHIITSSIEHHAVLQTVEQLELWGSTTTYLPVSEAGIVQTDDVRSALRSNTRLISVMMANNETGALQPVEVIGRIARDRGILFHTDAVQGAGKVPIDVNKIGCDLLSISAHKMHGPQGIGALFVRKGVSVAPMLHGGGHERGLRAGTENVAGIVGFGEAARIARAGFRDGSLRRMEALRNELEHSLLREVGNAGVNGSPTARVPNTVNLWFGGVVGTRLLRMLDERGLAVSGGSACNAGSCTPSHVLTAMGLPLVRAASSVRFSLSKFSSAEEVDYAIWQVAEVVEELRAGAVSSTRKRKVKVAHAV